MRGLPGNFVDSLTLQKLASDMERIARGSGPSPGDLSRCPVLLDWKLDWIRVPVLAGIVSGHQSVGPGPAQTSQLFALDLEDARWARTMNNWYLLRKLPSDG